MNQILSTSKGKQQKDDINSISLVDEILFLTRFDSVFVVPAFELTAHVEIPQTKEEMVELWHEDKARQIRIL